MKIDKNLLDVCPYDDYGFEGLDIFYAKHYVASLWPQFDYFGIESYDTEITRDGWKEVFNKDNKDYCFAKTSNELMERFFNELPKYLYPIELKTVAYNPGWFTESNSDTEIVCGESLAWTKLSYADTPIANIHNFWQWHDSRGHKKDYWFEVKPIPNNYVPYYKWRYLFDGVYFVDYEVATTKATNEFIRLFDNQQWVVKND